MRLKKLAFLICIVLGLAVISPGLVSAAPGWGYPAWQYRQKITVLNSKVPGNLSDFPVLISLTHTGLKDNAQADGDDIIITTSDGVTQVDHEIESYNTVTGELVAWAKAPAVSGSTDTDFYIYFGNGAVGPQENVVGTWNSSFSLVHHMKDDPDDANITDSTNNNNDGSKKASAEPAQATGKIAKSQLFDGADDYINISDSPSLNPSSISIEAWIKPSAFDANDMFITKGSSGAGMLDFDFRTMLGVPRFGFYNGTWYSVSAGSSLTLNQWHYVVATYDGTTMKIYVDGAQAGSAVIGVPLPDTAEDLRLGIYAWSSANWFDGGVDEVRLSSSDRSADWIETSYNNQSDPAGFFDSPLAAQEVAPVPATGVNMTLLGALSLILMGSGGAIIRKRLTFRS